MNESPKLIKKGIIGELLVQLRLISYNIEISKPLIDSGNDIIALKGVVTKAIQVKTTFSGSWRLSNLPEKYNILALVRFSKNEELKLDQAEIYLLSKKDLEKYKKSKNLSEYKLSEERINCLFK